MKMQISVSIISESSGRVFERAGKGWYLNMYGTLLRLRKEVV